MKKTDKRNFIVSIIFLLAFILWTVSITVIDVQNIGPQNSAVGFATLNGAFHKLTGVHMSIYDITDVMGILTFGIVGAFGVLGLIQMFKRKSLLKVDYDILVLGCFYVVVLAAFVFFEIFEVNYRPILIEGVLETSYPSSTTMLAMCVFPTAIMQLSNRIANNKWRLFAVSLLGAITVFMVFGRLFSGVHWLTDIIGGAILSAALVMLYYSFVNLKIKK